MYGIHNNHDHIDKGDRVKGDRGGRKERGVVEWREVGERRKRVGERWEDRR